MGMAGSIRRDGRSAACAANENSAKASPAPNTVDEVDIVNAPFVNIGSIACTGPQMGAGDQLSWSSGQFSSDSTALSVHEWSWPTPGPEIEGVLVHHRCHLLLDGQFLREDHLAKLGVSRLAAEVDALADDGIGVDVDDLSVLRLLNELVGGQLFHGRKALRGVCGLWNEAGGREQI